jgi:hypothetical protein
LLICSNYRLKIAEIIIDVVVFEKPSRHGFDFIFQHYYGNSIRQYFLQHVGNLFHVLEVDEIEEEPEEDSNRGVGVISGSSESEENPDRFIKRNSRPFHNAL